MTAKSASAGESQAVKLDWSRLFGFDQASGSVDGTAAAKLTDPRLARLGAKVGVKPGVKIGCRQPAP